MGGRLQRKGLRMAALRQKAPVSIREHLARMLIR